MFLDPWLPDFSFLFLSILVEGAPFILLGTIISGFIDVYLPSGAIDRLLPRNRGLAVLMSGLLGIIFPVCECAVVPVIRRLVKKGLPPACASWAPPVRLLALWVPPGCLWGASQVPPGCLWLCERALKRFYLLSR